MKKYYVVILIFFVIFGLFGCTSSLEITVQVDQTINLDVNTTGDFICKSSDENIYRVYNYKDNTIAITGVNVGVAELIIQSGYNQKVIKITVTLPDKLTDVNNIIKEMSIEEKIGQMFIVGFTSTSLPTITSTNISTYKFGNFIYMADNVLDPQKTIDLTTSIQNKVMNEINIPAFISIDQEGGMVERLLNGATHFPSNMAITATNDSTNAYKVGKAVGIELRSYGINVDFAPVLDVNNNPQNPIIGVRSYSDNPEMVSLYGNQMIRGLRESQVMATSKHFPGHGDTDIDSHFGLPRIPHNLERLYEIELAPFISAINNGIDAIMTTHIVFDAIDPDYPATLSKKVLTGLLRNDLKYNGLIITDGMGMNAIRDNFGYDEAGVLAVLAGVDILTFTESTTNSIAAYNGILNAVKTGRIIEERIDESVRRILLKKYEYDLFYDYLPDPNAYINIIDHTILNKELSKKSLTLAKGNFTGLDKTKSTLIISTKSSRYTLAPNLVGDNNSLAYLASMKLKEKGFYNVKSLVIGNTFNQTDILNQVNNYQQVIFACENVNVNQANLVKEIQKINSDMVAIALNKPYDINLYPTVENYLCVYEYTPTSVATIIEYLNGEFTATGILPVKLK